MMNPTHPYSREHLQQAIDDEIKSLEESIRVLKSRRNTHSPVSSLPPEILTAIFFYVCLPGIPLLGGKPRKSHLARFRISHVCHQWREMALNQPLLWSHINSNTLSSAGVTEVLLRAKSVPLYLEERAFSYGWSNVKRGISEKVLQLQLLVPRICHFSITADSDTLPSTLEGLVSPAPTLEYLKVSVLKRKISIPDNLFNGCTPRLSCLELRNCDISWKSPLLKGLKYLDIRRLQYEDARPELAVWLDALCELPQIKALTLHSAAPIALSSPFDVERILTLSSLTLLDVSDAAWDCALALAHLNLPALTCLRLNIISPLPNYSDVRDLLPYVMRHAHSPQDARPLQSVLISNFEREYYRYLRIAAWTVPDIDTEVHDPPALLGATFPPRITLSFESMGRLTSGEHRQILDLVMMALPLNDLVMLAAQDLHLSSDLAGDLRTQQFWLRHAPQWPLLRRVRLAPPVTCGFIRMLLEDNGGRERPVLPSLTELVLGCDSSDGPLICDTLMKRVEQGVPFNMLDLRTCQYDSDSLVAVQSFSEIVVNVLGPDPEARKRIRPMWDTLARDPFTELEDDEETDDEKEEEKEDR